MTLRARWLILAAAALLASCVTVNIYFPAAAIQKAADEIVDEVRKGAPPAPEGTPPPSPGRSSVPAWLEALGLTPAVAHAQVDLNVSTPAIRALRASMAARFPQLQPLYARGVIGETSNGLLATRDTAALSLKERADVTRLVDQENADRRALYAEIIRANNLPADSLGEVQRLFANSWRDKSSPGWWIQRDDGQWARK